MASEDFDFFKPGEEEDFTTFSRLAQKWGWQWAVFCRGDVEARLERELTAEEWDRVRLTHWWRSLGDIADEYAKENVYDVLREAGLDDE